MLGKYHTTRDFSKLYKLLQITILSVSISQSVLEHWTAVFQGYTNRKMVKVVKMKKYVTITFLTYLLLLYYLLFLCNSNTRKYNDIILLNIIQINEIQLFTKIFF